MRLIQVNLERQTHKVFTANTAADALAQALEHLPHLMILDELGTKAETDALIETLRQHSELDDMEICRLREASGKPPTFPNWPPRSGPFKFA